MAWPPRTPLSILPPGLISELTEKQRQLRKQLIIQKIDRPIHIIAGCDSALLDNKIFSVFVLFEYPSLKEIEVQTSFSPLTLPYIPGLLAFREIPNLLLAFQKIQHKPDLIMVDGHGIMHPRRMGIAAHLGIVLNVPTFGVAKKRLAGTYLEPDIHKGDYTYVTHQKETVGIALRSKDKVKPIFISPGHLCDISTVTEITLNTLKKHKLPEPTRLADLYSKKLKYQQL